MLEKLLAMSIEKKLALIRLYDEFDIELDIKEDMDRYEDISMVTYEEMITLDLKIIYIDMFDFVQPE